MFNGKDLKGWAGALDNYEVINGSLQCKNGKGGTIYTLKKYDNFSVDFEFLLPKGGNNGLAIRYPGKGNPAYDGMCELQILDNKDPRYAKLDPRQYHGSAYGLVPAKKGFLKKTGEWNHQRVTVEGSKIIVVLNGHLILNTDINEISSFMNDKKHPGILRKDGHFGFAGHKDPVSFRKIKIKRI